MPRFWEVTWASSYSPILNKNTTEVVPTMLRLDQYYIEIEHKLDVPDIPVPGPLLPPGCIQHPHLQGGQESQQGQGDAIKVGEVRRASRVRVMLSR